MSVLKRMDGTVIAEDPDKIFLELCEENKADLSRAYLSGAYLSGADLSGANLYGANLYGADLSRADLSGADLYGANLSRADLSRANLSGAYLSRADLSGATLNWNSHTLLSELLFQVAYDNTEKLKVAAVVACGTRLNWCWEGFAKFLPELREWRLEVYAKHDNLEGAPQCVIDKAKEMNGKAVADGFPVY